MTTQYKHINRIIVGETARRLIAANGKTTTLEVKNDLRSNGYWAQQHQVRDFMLDITSNDGDVQYTDDPAGYRVYAFTTVAKVLIQDALDTDGTSLFTLGQIPMGTTSTVGGANAFDTDMNDGLPPVFTLTSEPIKVRHDARDNEPADYVVTDPKGDFYGRFTSVTRSAAKHLWSKLFGLPFSAARTKKL